jgi:general secretion pathway protein H
VIVVRRPASGARNRESGFSLFELIVVLMIVAIASGLAAPGIQSGWRSREVRTGTRDLAAIMRGLRERAVRRGVEQELVLEADGQTYSWTDGKETSLPGGATITGIRGGWRDQDGRVRVIFYPNGGSSGVSLVVAQADGDSLSFNVRVDPLLGSVVIQDAT